MLVIVDCDRIKLVVNSFAIKTCYFFLDLTFKDLISFQNNLFMNYMLSSIIYLDPNTVMTSGTSSHKSKFIYHFKIVNY